MTLRPIDAHGQRFQTSDPMAIIAWLQSEGFSLVEDQPALVELERGTERIRIASDGLVSPMGDSAPLAVRRLLYHCEEGKAT